MMEREGFAFETYWDDDEVGWRYIYITEEMPLLNAPLVFSFLPPPPPPSSLEIIAFL